jgi:hypothetical protein
MDSLTSSDLSFRKGAYSMNRTSTESQIDPGCTA